MSAAKPENQTEVSAAPYFYLSYARAEHGLLVRQFFNDLSDSVRIRAGLPLTQIVGCCGAFGQDAKDRQEGLRTSCLMIALLSPAYFEDETAGREWRVFEIRKSKASATDRRTLTRSIIPISWRPYSGPMPVVVSQAAIFGQNQNEGHGYEPVDIMLRSRRKHKEYAEFVNSLAHYVVDSTASFHLPELESTPDEVSNAFADRKEPEMNSQTTSSPPRQKLNPNVNKIINQNLLIIDEAFVKGITGPAKETAATPVPVSEAGFWGQTTKSKKAVNEIYRVFTIGEDVQKIETAARLSPDFDVKTFTNAQRLLDEVRDLLKDRKEPDLIVVNPALIVPGTHRFNLVQALLNEKPASAILATSNDPDAISSVRSAGISDLVTFLPESFTQLDVLQLMTQWAKAGRDKRYQRGRSDERPVFLSFTSPDEAMAGQICKWLELREIGVWYSLQTLKAGDPWIERIKQGLASAKVFIALISEDYPKSDWCPAELGIILNRLKNETTDLLLIPVHYRSPTQALKDPQIQMIQEHQVVKISDRDWLPGLQQILGSVQSF